MRTINKQGRHAAGVRVAAMTVRQALKNLGVKEFPEVVDNWRHRLSVSPSVEPYAIRMLGCVDPDSTAGIQSSNDDRAEPIREDDAGYQDISPLEHSSAISYIASCTPEHRLIYVSRQIGNLGFSPEDLFDQPDVRLKQMHEEDIGRFDQALQKSCNAAEKFDCHYRLYDKDGKVRWFHDEASVVCDELGVPLFIKGVMLEITAQKHMEDELAEHRYCLERNVELRTSQLAKRLATLEACNASLCAQLSAAKIEIAAMRQQTATDEPDVA